MGNKKLNALGKFEYLELFNEKGIKVYWFRPECRWNNHWNLYTYNSNGDELMWESSRLGIGRKITYDSNGYWITFENSLPYWEKRTVDSKGKELTWENSRGEKRGFDSIEQTTLKQENNGG
jgi:hypothetical protein